MKYKPQYHLPPGEYLDWTKQDRLNAAPIWCSVDLRDGNQSLITPMSLDEKIEYYKFLLGVGFKQIEVGFPAASETEYAFLRTLIDQDLIPDDVTIQVLTQSRQHIIEKTFEAIRGVKRVIVHLYNSTSIAQREQVFKKSKDEIVQIAVDGAKLFNEYAAKMPETQFSFEYSPESFTGTEPQFALDICNAVIDVWLPSKQRPVIINLPATVENAMPHVYARQIAYMSQNLRYRENVIVSLHPHNDRGTAVAAAEMGVLAGADRVEGTLFGNGERTGNVDIITMALNLYTHGVDPQLDLSDMPNIVRKYEQATNLIVNDRHPYAGKLVFAAFSGSHQDAIAKGMQFRQDDNAEWNVPYLPLDPRDVSREYESDVIRINSQSGKGGIAYVLGHYYGYQIPAELRAEVGYFIKNISDKAHKELSPAEIHEAFLREYVNVNSPVRVTKDEWRKDDAGQTIAEITAEIHGATCQAVGNGNGQIDALTHALLNALPHRTFSFKDYSQHALGSGSDAQAVSYVKLCDCKGRDVWGVGADSDVTEATLRALLSAVNRLELGNS
ncbi:MAG: 2-isopropylmalate synthase [Oscillospiraceae bacterium]|nr:2-isopropylmalate synthase [Oscillospiraceae bacterium]